MVDMKNSLTIDEVAKRTGLSAHTLRYYERIGLIARVPRAAGGQRRYTASEMAWIEFLLCLRTMNMPVRQMQAFAGLRSEGDVTIPERREMLEKHLLAVNDLIRNMQQSVAVLENKIIYYRAMEVSPVFNKETAQGENHESGSLSARPRKTE